MSFASNTLVTSTKVAKESLMQLENNLGMAKMIYRDWENKLTKDGETLGIREPNKFRATKARSRSNSALSESNLTLTVATQAHVSYEWSTKEMTDTIERVSERYITPAMSALANTVDVDLYDMYKDIPNQVGTAGVDPGGYDAYVDARQKMNEEAAPVDGRFVNVNPAAEAATLKGLKGLFNEKLINGVIAKGAIGALAGFDFYMGQNVQMHTTGKFTTNATPLVKGASQSGSSLIVDGWATDGSSTIKEGDVFTIADVYAVNPKTGESTGSLRQFVVTADATMTAGSAPSVTLSIEPDVTTGGAYQTVNSSPANDAAVTFVGSESTQYPINLAFHKTAFTLAMRPLEIPSSVVYGARQSYNGLSMRAIKAFDIDEDKEVIRFDILYGVLCQTPLLACRIIGG